MKNSDLVPSPSLAAPGAGLPLPELLIARMRFKAVRKLNSREDLDARFEAERAQVLELGRSLSEEDGGKQVLIRRLRGLEDSSRDWSVFMVVEHLRIVNMAMLGVVRTLARGEVPGGSVSTGDVKPEPGIGSGVLEDFDRSCGVLAKAFSQISNLETDVRHAHPWFGQLNVAGWHALGAMHTGLHRKQIERILKTGTF